MRRRRVARNSACPASFAAGGLWAYVSRSLFTPRSSRHVWLPVKGERRRSSITLTLGSSTVPALRCYGRCIRRFHVRSKLLIQYGLIARPELYTRRGLYAIKQVYYSSRSRVISTAGGERLRYDCSISTRAQKLMDERPSYSLIPATYRAVVFCAELAVLFPPVTERSTCSCLRSLAQL